MSQVTIDHCVIAVSNWNASNAFYRDVVGAVIVERAAVTSTASVSSTSASTARKPTRRTRRGDQFAPETATCASSGAVESRTRSPISPHMASRSKPDLLKRKARSAVTADTSTSANPDGSLLEFVSYV